MYIKKPVMKSAGVIIASFQSSTMPRISTSEMVKRKKRMPLGATVPKGVNLAGVKRTNASIVAKRCRKAGSYCEQREQSSVQVI